MEILGIPIFFAVLPMLATALIFAAIETRSGFLGTVVFLASAAALYLTGALTSVIAAFGLTGLMFAFLGYFVLGAVWAVIEWWFFLQMARRIYDAGFRSTSLKSNPGLDDVVMSNRYFTMRRDFPPKVSNFKGDIMMWIAFWPWAAVWRIVNDPLTRLVKGIYYSIAGFLQKMSDNTFSDVKNESET